MSDIRLNRLANVLVNYSTKVKAGDWVHVNANWQAIPLVKEVVAYILRVGGNPSVPGIQRLERDIYGAGKRCATVMDAAAIYEILKKD